MSRRSTILALTGGMVVFAWLQPARADITPPSLTTPNKPTGLDLIAPPSPPAAKPAPTGNPLWAIPLSALTVTRERPLFSPSRRPPAPVIASPPAVEPPKPAPPAGPTRPQFTFVGAVTGESEGFAIFLDAATNKIIRLRTGQDYAGWVLNSVKGREATLQRNGETAVFALPAPSDTATPASVPAAIAVPGGGVAAPSVPVAPPGAAIVRPSPGQNFAPFVPRQTPKRGEPDGL